MKKYTNLILVGIIVVLAAGLAGTLLYLKNQPLQKRGFEPIIEIASMEPDSSKWGINFPNEYATLLKTGNNNVPTTYGGSEKFSHLIDDPRQVILFAGYSFSKEYNEDRGHQNSLTDVRAIKRVDEKTHATCYSCKSSDNPRLWSEMGMGSYDAMLFSKITPELNNPIGCANCHEAGTMRLIVTNPALEAALQAQGMDWQTFSRQEMRSVVCANCHVEYYFVGDDKVLTLPWADGTRVEEIIEYYDDIGFADWKYPGTETSMLKAQHPDFEMFTADSTHYKAGVACADCHMPYVRDGAVKYSSHDVHSPLLNPEQACGQCHSNVEYVVGRVETIQDEVYQAKLAAEDAIVDAINAIQAAVKVSDVDPILLDEALMLHRHAQFRWDFVSAENSMGFHNPEEALCILGDATNLARQAQMKAAQAAHSPSILETGSYYILPSIPTPVP